MFETQYDKTSEVNLTQLLTDLNNYQLPPSQAKELVLAFAWDNRLPVTVADLRKLLEATYA